MGSDEGEADGRINAASSSSESVSASSSTVLRPMFRRDGRGDGVRGHDVTIFFYNPNIHPKRSTRYEKGSRNKRYAEKLGIDFVDLDGDVDEWYRRAKGMEFCPERGARCTMCFDMRLERTALYAYENGFDSLTTTNATSRWKDEAQVNGSVHRKRRESIRESEYWLSDWQSEEMTRVSTESTRQRPSTSRSTADARTRCATRTIGGRNKDAAHRDWRSGFVLLDPEVDEQEESVEVVKSFFADSNAFEEELKTTYAARRKDSKGRGDESVNNW